MQLRLREDAVLCEELDVLRVQKRRDGVDRRLQVQKPAAFGLFDPFVRVAVAVEQDALVLLDGLFDERVERLLKVRGRLQRVGKLGQLLGRDRVEHDVRVCDGIRRTEHAEFELVARKCKRRRAVAVGRVLREARQRVHADLENFLVAVAVRLALL